MQYKNNLHCPNTLVLTNMTGSCKMGISIDRAIKLKTGKRNRNRTLTPLLFSRPRSNLISHYHFGYFFYLSNDKVFTRIDDDYFMGTYTWRTTYTPLQTSVHTYGIRCRSVCVRLEWSTFVVYTYSLDLLTWLTALLCSALYLYLHRSTRKP